MIDRLEICADINLSEIEDAIIKAVDTEDIDSLCTECFITKNNLKYFLVLKVKNYISEQIIADILSDWIRNCYELHMIKTMLRCEFREEDINKNEVLKSAINNCKEKFYKKEYIVKKITKYLKNENTIMIDGFIRFRMPEYRRAIYINICEAIEEYYIEKEYESFIELLKEYIEYKPSLIDLVHIKTDSDGNFSFYDFSMNKIEIEAEKETAQNPIEIFLTNDDILVSILIALSPKRIIWHKPEYLKNQNVFNTIQLIFGKRFSVCNQCDLCNE